MSCRIFFNRFPNEKSKVAFVTCRTDQIVWRCVRRSRNSLIRPPAVVRTAKWPATAKPSVKRPFARAQWPSLAREAATFANTSSCRKTARRWSAASSPAPPASIRGCYLPEKSTPIMRIIRRRMPPKCAALVTLNAPLATPTATSIARSAATFDIVTPASPAAPQVRFTDCRTTAY